VRSTLRVEKKKKEKERGAQGMAAGHFFPPASLFGSF
jgi:hypothetical protein